MDCATYFWKYHQILLRMFGSNQEGKMSNPELQSKFALAAESMETSALSALSVKFTPEIKHGKVVETA